MSKMKSQNSEFLHRIYVKSFPGAADGRAGGVPPRAQRDMGEVWEEIRANVLG